MKFVLFLGIVAVVCVAGEALQCFKCFNCKDDFEKDDKLLVPCTGTTAACVKGVITYQNKTTVTGRDCSEDIDKIQTSIKGTPTTNLSLFESAELFFCNSDKCNSTGSITGILSIVFTTVIASIFASF